MLTTFVSYNSYIATKDLILTDCNTLRYYGTTVFILTRNLINQDLQREGSLVSKTSTAPRHKRSLSKLGFSVHMFPFLEFDLLLKGEDVLLVEKVYELEMFVEHVAVVLGPRCPPGVSPQMRVRVRACVRRTNGPG